MTRRLPKILGVILGVLSAAACGSERASSIVAPSSLTASASATSATASTLVIPGLMESAETGPISAAITVTGLVAGTACPSLQFTVSTYVFTTSGSTQYSGGSCADIRAGSNLMIVGARASETVQSIAVTQITFKTGERPPTTPPPTTPTTPPGTIRAEGIVASIISPSACPALYFTMADGHTFNTNAATQYSGAGCTSIKVGSKVYVSGTMQSDGIVLASQLAIAYATPPAPPPTPQPPRESISGDGVVSGLVSGTSCPALNFLIGPYTIKLTASTQYVGGSCTDVKVGLKVGIVGSKDNDGSLILSQLTIRTDQATRPDPTTPPVEPPVEGEGVVSGLVEGTTCPALQFLIGKYTIKTTASTQYNGGTCTDVKAGVRVGIRGQRQNDGSIIVASISVKGEPPQPQAEGEGIVTGLAGGTACPTLQLLIGAYTINLDSSTQYNGGSCTDIKVGTKIYVKGGVTGDRTVRASIIAIKS